MTDRKPFQCTLDDDDRFCAVAARCMLMDTDESLTFHELLEKAAQRLAEPAGVDPARLMEAFHARETESSTVVGSGIAIPHVILDGIPHAVMLLVRCRSGIRFPGHQNPVFALLMLVEGYEHRYFHLQALAALSRWAHEPDFLRCWMETPSMETLRDTLLEKHRVRCTLHLDAAAGI